MYVHVTVNGELVKGSKGGSCSHFKVLY